VTLANSAYQKFGALDLPLNPDDFTDGLSPLDPAKHTLTELFKAAINAELGEVWDKLVGLTNGAGLVADHILKDTEPVESTLELEPSPTVIKEWKADWPLLVVHRTGTGTYEQVTLQEERLTQQWLVHYILAPGLDVGDARKFVDALTAAAKIIRMVIRDRGHRAYQSGALQFFDDTTSIASIELKSQEGPGQAQFAGEGGPVYYAITLTLETVERCTDKTDQFEEGKGLEIDVGVGSQDEILPSLIQGDSEADPYQYG